MQTLLYEEAARWPEQMIPFRRWMELALYAPERGYYASGRDVVGRHGDFITSVSVGPLFARLLAVEFEAMWQALGRPPRFTIVEQGANNGEFADDLLRAATAWPEWEAALDYRIVEPLAPLQHRQRQRLAAWGERVSWVEEVAALPEWTGVCFSNELVDAMPVHRVIWREGEWREQYVAPGADGEWEWREGAISTPALSAFLQRGLLPEVEGYTTEVNLEGPRWVAEVAARLTRGYFLVADYGFSRRDYYLPERMDGTLTAYQQHRRLENVLATPGECDLTAHVDFTSLAEAGEAAGLALAGFTDQHHYLVALGKLLFRSSVEEMTPEYQRDLRQFATLMHPSSLGRGFQFLAMAKAADPHLPGFAFAGAPRQALGLG